MAKRQILIVQTTADLKNSAGESESEPASDASDENDLVTLGSLDEVINTLSNHNVAPETPGGSFLYGPGLSIQVPMNPNTEVMQVLCSLIDEDIAWPVLFRLCKLRHWSLMDPESGRILHISEDATM